MRQFGRYSECLHNPTVVLDMLEQKRKCFNMVQLIKNSHYNGYIQWKGLNVEPIAHIVFVSDIFSTWLGMLGTIPSSNIVHMSLYDKYRLCLKYCALGEFDVSYEGIPSILFNVKILSSHPFRVLY